MEIVAYQDARAYSRSQHLFPDEMHYRDVDSVVDKWVKLFRGATAICICIYVAARSVVLTRDGAGMQVQWDFLVIAQNICYARD